MAVQVAHFNPQQRFAEKERARRADERAVRAGKKSAAQVKRESASFAFPKNRASINIKSARSLV